MKKFAFILVALLALSATPAYAVKVADITRLSGQRSNLLTGFGLVFGLNGTGDGGDYLPAIKPLASMLGKFGSRPPSLSGLSLEPATTTRMASTPTAPARHVLSNQRKRPL